MLSDISCRYQFRQWILQQRVDDHTTALQFIAVDSTNTSALIFID
ncbi:MAG: hypothetical protein ACI9FO_000756 [Methylophagaceae bacterium]|jgi:hypothetical protein